MRVIAENSDAELAQQRARQEVEQSLRQLAANLLRVVRGAGKPYAITSDAAEFLTAAIAYRDAVGLAPSSEELASALNVFREDPEREPRLSDREFDRQYANETIVRGSLQIAASRLLKQLTQQSAGESELHDGVRQLEKVQEDMRKEQRLAVQAQPKSRLSRPVRKRSS